MIGYFAQHQAAAEASDEGYYGFIMTLDVYGLALSPEQYSLASVWLIHDGDGAAANYNAIQIGWEAAPSVYGDSRTRLAATWTSDGFQRAFCRNADCAVGFQPEEGAPMALGDVIQAVSQPGGPKQTITIKVIKDGELGDWLAYCGLNADGLALIGRFPRSLFAGGMADRASRIQFGGFVQTRATDLAPMGSGYLPTNVAAASISDVQFIDRSGNASPVTGQLPTYMTDPNIYVATDMADGQFFYGGPLESTD
ncbi:uncharacterized protein [Aegilops tauschii subsp. strangulata]|uniref:uncharacterized protein n=1 Tax=Aegilops tauschii subsp. strangulata TaxID=200361 RepID=UPI00098AA887|nr:uncharacterized protein LOC109761667 [Aegilops tauschii subsp. strangulata]